MEPPRVRRRTIASRLGPSLLSRIGGLAPILAAGALASGFAVAQPAPPVGVEALAAAADPGPYAVASWDTRHEDAARHDRVVRLRVYYPAAGDAGAGGPAVIDASGAPYPVVVGDGIIGAVFGPHLASHGFVFVAAQSQGPFFTFPHEAMIDFPLDLVFGLDRLAAGELGVPAAAVDPDRTGVVGHSFGSWNALALAGARVDPQHLQRTCAERPAEWSDNWWTYVCGTPERWAGFEAAAREVGLETPTGLWEPFADTRIRAAMALGPEGFDLTGPAGLAGVQAPVLLVGAGADEINDYVPATTELFAHLPSATLITFLGARHLWVFVRDAQTHLRRFALAFFDAHLRGGAAWADVLTPAFVEEVAPTLGGRTGFEGLVWGVAGGGR